MHRTITFNLWWQINTIDNQAIEPTPAYVPGGANCFAGIDYTTLVEVGPDLFVGHVDYDHSQYEGYMLGVYKGTPQEIAARLRADFLRLEGSRSDQPQTGMLLPAQMCVWLREFSDEGGAELKTEPLLEWRHPATLK
ncbi:MAG TPA: hypothetical protein VM581_01575 [Magnetospirillaceae bacterium]|nr:hypothetical protein [Magnetospirillaceae bacterium]